MSGAAITLPQQLTMAVAAAAHAQVQAALAGNAAAQPVTVNAEPLREFDTSALAVLLELRRVCEARGTAMTLAGAPAKLTQLAALYGVDELLGLKKPEPPASRA